MSNSQTTHATDDASILADVLSRTESALAHAQLPAEVFSSPQVFEAEMRNVFGKSWVFVAHESELPQPGDYVLRRLGGDSVIVSRDEAGDLHVLLNNCRHRGTTVCNDDRGNTSHFRCPYHGWIYRNDGTWVGAAHKLRAYRELDPAQWGLLAAPHVDSFLGLIFANLDPDAVPLVESLGDMTWFLTALLGLDSRGMQVIGEPVRWIAHADWKSGSENFGGDNYHTDQTHISVDEVGLGRNYRKQNNFIRQFEAGNGHILTTTDLKDQIGDSSLNPWAYPDSVWQSFDLRDVTAEQIAMIENHMPLVGTIFPNLSFIRSSGAADPATGERAVYTSLRQWQPRGPGETEVWSWLLRWTIEPDEYAVAAYNEGLYRFGPAGMLEQDDMAVWEGAPIAARSAFAQSSGMQFNYQLGTEGMGVGSYVEDWTGPGTSFVTAYGEGNQRSFYRRWLASMRTAK